jgi:hypothetical protein
LIKEYEDDSDLFTSKVINTEIGSFGDDGEMAEFLSVHDYKLIHRRDIYLAPLFSRVECSPKRLIRFEKFQK